MALVEPEDWEPVDWGPVDWEPVDWELVDWEPVDWELVEVCPLLQLLRQPNMVLLALEVS